VPLQYQAGTPDNVTTNYYVVAFIDTNGNGALDFDGAGAPLEPVVGYNATGGTNPPGTLLNISSDQTGKSFGF
jgi:uncharacterized protein (DUF2141 family)